MTCEHCTGAEEFFDQKTARKELKKYLKSGPRGATRRIIDLLRIDNAETKTLLDIGGGIGAIQWSFLEKNGSRTTGVDASGAYLSVAMELADEKHWKEQTHFIKADFTDISQNLHPHSIVTLDKVVCCYPDFSQLIKEATSKCEEKLAMSYPMGGWVPRVLSKMAALYFKWKGNAFRTYIHPKKQLQAAVRKGGFELTQKGRSFPWHIEIWERSS